MFLLLDQQIVKLFIYTWFIHFQMVLIFQESNYLSTEVFSLASYFHNIIRKKTRYSFTLRGSSVPGKPMKTLIVMICAISSWSDNNQTSVPKLWDTNYFKSFFHTQNTWWLTPSLHRTNRVMRRNNFSLIIALHFFWVGVWLKYRAKWTAKILECWLWCTFWSTSCKCCYILLLKKFWVFLS